MRRRRHNASSVLSAYYSAADVSSQSERYKREAGDEMLVNGPDGSSKWHLEDYVEAATRPRYDFHYVASSDPEFDAITGGGYNSGGGETLALYFRRPLDSAKPNAFPWPRGSEMQLFDRESRKLVHTGRVLSTSVDANTRATGHVLLSITD